MIGVTSGLNRALLPTMATLPRQASISPFLDSVGSSLESHGFTTSWRQPRPPLALMYSAKPLTASMLPWNRPGARGEPVSAITVTVMVSAVTPTSVASRVTPSHAASVSADEVGSTASPPGRCDRRDAASTAVRASRPNTRCRAMETPRFQNDCRFGP